MKQSTPTERLVAPSADLLSRLQQQLAAPFSIDLQQQHSAPCQRLDTVTDSLFKSGKILLSAPGRLLLVTPSSSYTLEMDGPAPRLRQDVPDAAFQAAIGEVSALRCLLPSQALTCASTAGKLLDDEAKTCVRFSALTLQGSDGGATLIDLYPLRGYGDEYGLLVDALKKLGAAASDGAAAALQLSGYQGHGYVSNPAIALPAGIDVKRAATAMIRSYIAVARSNERGVIDDLDTEFLHDYRVSLRRVRSIISLFKGAYQDGAQRELGEQLAAHMRETNRLRDLDVWLLDKAHYYALLPTAMHGGLDNIFASFSRSRSKAQRRLVKRLRSDCYLRDMAALQAQFEHDDVLPAGGHSDKPARDYAAALIIKRYNKVCKIARSIDEHTPDPRVHELRLQCKKLRYLLDLSAPLFEVKKVKRITRSLKRLQDNLGRFNDFSVQQVALQSFLDEQLARGTAVEPATVQAVGALIALQHQQQQHERQRVMDNFALFHSAETDQLIKRLFQPAKNGGKQTKRHSRGGKTR